MQWSREDNNSTLGHLPHQLLLNPEHAFLFRAQGMDTQRVDPSYIGLSTQEGLYLIPPPMRHMPSVVIVRNNFRPRLLTGQIPLCAYGRFGTQMDVVYSVVYRHEILDGIHTVIHGDQLFGEIVLSQKIFDGARNESPPVIGRHDAGDEGLAVHSPSSRV
jgi:hypothetical protein